MRSGKRIGSAVVLLCCGVLLTAGMLYGQKGGSPPPSYQPGSHVPSAPMPNVSTVPQFQSFDKSPLKFSARAYYVLVPVLVHDKNNQHVGGLDKDFFQLFEDGKEQKISSVDEIKTSTSPVVAAARSANEFTNQPTVEGGERRITVIALDLINTPFLDQAGGRQAAIKFLAENISGDSLFQLVTLDNNGVHVVHDFTSDTAVLVKALKAVSSKFSSTNTIDRTLVRQGSTNPGDVDSAHGIVYTNAGGVQGVDFESTALTLMAGAEKQYAEYQDGLAAASTLEGFQQIAQRLNGIPGRKSLIWITGSFPFTIDTGTNTISTGVSWDGYMRAMQMLNAANVVLYPVDARGLVIADQADASMHLTGKALATLPDSMNAASRDHADTLATMRAFAEMTGGRAYLNRNDLERALREANEDGASYYMLSYALDKNNTKPGWRKFKVVVKKPDCHVRTRAGFFISRQTLDPNNTEKVDIFNALNSPLEYTSIPVRVKLDATADSGKNKKIGFALFVPPNVAKVDEKNHLSFEVWYTVRDAKGKDVAHKNQIYNVDLTPVMLAQLQSQGIGYNDTVELPPGRYNLRVVVRDNFTGQMGSLWAPLKME